MSETQSARSRRRARGRSPFRVDADHGALVPARRRAPDRGHPRRARLGLGRRGLPRADAALPRPAVHDLGRRPDPEPRDEPEDGEPDHPLRGGAPRGARRPAGSRSASCAGHVTSAGRRQRRPGQERARRSSRSRSTRPPAHKAEKAANSLAELGHRRRLDLRRPEDRAPQQADRVEQGRARPTSTSAISNAVAQQQAVINDKTISSTDKLIAISTSNNTISFSEQRRGTVQQELFQNQQLLSLAENVEKSKIVQPAVGEQDDRDEPPQRRPDRGADRPAARSARRRDRRPVPPAKGRAERRVAGR